MTSAGHHVMLEGMSAPPAPAYWGLCFTAEEPNVVVNMAKTGSPPAVTLETSTDGVTWTAFDAVGGTTPVTLAAIGDHVFFRAGAGGNSRMASGASAYRSFTLSGRCAASGSVMSLLSASDSDMSFTTATTGTYALAWLFDGCATLTSAPRLTSKSTRSNCYRYMFRGCTSLRRAPRLAAYNLSSNTAAYYGMFDGCSSLELVEVLVVPPSSWNSMFANFVSTSGASRLTIRTLEASADEIEPHLQEGWTLETIPHPFAVVSSANISISCVAELIVSTDLGDTWTTYSGGSSVSLSARSVAMFRATAEAVPATSSRHVTIPSGSNVVIAGELTTLVTKSGDVSSLPTGCFGAEFKYTGTIGTTHKLRAGYLRLPSFVSSRCFYSMFALRTDLTVPPRVLPATTLASQCYSNMFKGCTSLVSAPELPATTLANDCYSLMFQGCTSLVSAPSLPATTLASQCYSSMFSGCTALVAAPSLPATTLASQCYSNMFQSCTSLVSAPELPATTLANDCYSLMFQGCTSLVSAPELPATTLAVECYWQMFSGCTALVAAPSLPATTLAIGCCFQMFQGCTSLVSAPELPATTLARGCFQNMFSGCTALVAAPSLPAITLANSCYNSMFKNCTALTWIELAATSWTGATNSFADWVSGVAASGTFRCPTALGTDATITRGASNCPVGWTVVNTD